jgi:hypothetical protein
MSDNLQRVARYQKFEAQINPSRIGPSTVTVAICRSC